MEQGQETRAKHGRRELSLRVAFWGTIIGFVGMFLTPIIGVTIIALSWFAATYVLLFGCPGYYRVAQCMRCQSLIKIPKRDAGGDCPGCRIRVVLRDGRFHYV